MECTVCRTAGQLSSGWGRLLRLLGIYGYNNNDNNKDNNKDNNSEQHSLEKINIPPRLNIYLTF